MNVEGARKQLKAETKLSSVNISTTLASHRM